MWKVCEVVPNPSGEFEWPEPLADEAIHYLRGLTHASIYLSSELSSDLRTRRENEGSTMKRWSLATKLYALLFLLTLFVVGFGIHEVEGNIHNRSVVQSASRVNRLTDEFILASGLYAKERGFSAVVLASDPGDAHLLPEIHQTRQAADVHYRNGERELNEILQTEEGAFRLKAVREQLTMQRKAFEDARRQVDGTLSVANAHRLSPSDWIQIATGFIQAQAVVRLAANHPRTANEIVIHSNVQTKHLIWTASEFAGRERGNVGPLVAAKKPIPAEMMTKVQAWRAIVEHSITNVLAIRNDPTLDPRIRTAIEHMEQEFLGEWQKRRAEVLAAAATGAYPLSGEEWTRESTQAINSLLAVSEAASVSSADLLKSENTQATTELIVASVVTSIAIVLLIFSIYFLRVQLLMPLDVVAKTLEDNSNSVRNSSEQIARSSVTLSAGAHQQATAIEQTAASVQEITSMVERNSEHSRKSAELADASREAAGQGLGVVREMSVAMDEISQSNLAIMKQVETSNHEIGQIVQMITDIGDKTKIINEIVFQTKLLSFNASIEAARAGEHGKGFGVVAEEVGNLARTSGQAATEISALLKESLARVEGIVRNTENEVRRLILDGARKVEAGTSVTSKCADLLERLSGNIRSVSEMTTEISQASDEQSRGVHEISKAMGELDQVTQSNSNMAQAVAYEADALSLQAKSMDRVVVALLQLVNGGRGASLEVAWEDGQGEQKTTQGESSVVNGEDEATENRGIRPAA